MSSRKTTKLKLHAWEPSDRFMREEFNENFALIDGGFAQVDENAENARKELEAQIAAAAAAAASAAADAKSAAELAQTGVDAAASAATSAQQAANTAASAQKAADSATQSAQTAQNAATGKAQIETGSYKGTGTINKTSSSAVTLPIGFEAKAVWISTNGDSVGMDQYDNVALAGSIMEPFLLVTRDMSSVTVRIMDTKGQWVFPSISLVWTSTALKFYATVPYESTMLGGDFVDATVCLNKSGVTYRWIAIG